MARKKAHEKDEIKGLEAEGIKVLAVYNEPYNGKKQIFAMMPIELVKSAPFQRELSQMHVKKLADAIAKVGRFLDPIIVVRSSSGEYWTPNGHHRKEAALMLGLKEIPVILLLEEDAGRYVLAMNVEKTHTVRDKSLEVIRLYEEMLDKFSERQEREFEGIFESGAYATLGLIYKEEERFHGSAYESILKRIDHLLDYPLKEAYKIRKQRANLLKEVDVAVSEVVQQMRQKGINHPFLWQAVVNSASPIKRKRIVEESYEEVMNKLKENLTKISEEDLLGEEIDLA